METGIQMSLAAVGNWHGNRIWGLPLIVLNVVIHVLGLVFINKRSFPF
jgi:hypothetical protein